MLSDPTAENCRFQWTKGRLEAAQFLADDELTDVEIAARVGISERQLRTWKQHPDFRAKVDELAAELEAAILKRGIARKRHRIACLGDRHSRMMRLIAARATQYGADPEAGPGADTGLIVKQVRVIGQGAHAQTITEWAFDAPLMRELREAEKQAAQEVGEWTERHEHTGKDGGPIQQDTTLSVAALHAAEVAYLAASGLAPRLPADLGVRAGDAGASDTGPDALPAVPVSDPLPAGP